MAIGQIEASDKAKLQHMLGAIPGHHQKRNWGYRNHYAAAKGGAQEAAMRRLESAGLVEQGSVTENLIFFHATAAGCQVLNFDDSQTRRALED